MALEDHEEHDDTTEAHERRIKRCKHPACNARIVWLKTNADRNIPVDADTVEAGDTLFDPSKHTSHFATCTNAAGFRKKKR